MSELRVIKSECRSINLQLQEKISEVILILAILTLCNAILPFISRNFEK